MGFLSVGFDCVFGFTCHARWLTRYPSDDFDPMTAWDDVVRGRELFLQRLKDQLDGSASAAPRAALEVIDRVEMDMYERACAASRRQGNYSLSFTYLKDTNRLVKVCGRGCVGVGVPRACL